MAIRAAIELLAEPGAVVELRIPKTRRGSVSGYFSDFGALAKAAAHWSGKASGVYFTLNPVNSVLLARSANRVTEYAKDTTKDTDVLRRRWLFIDFDPVRPSGIPATEEEHRAALVRADEVSSRLSGEGWREPVVIDSGNGAYLLYRLDLPNDAVSDNLIKKALLAVDLQFSDELVAIDTGVSNPARIIRIPGTLNAKGDSMPERPHRLARIIAAPASQEVITRELIERLGALAPEASQAWPSGTGYSGWFDLECWLADHGLTVTKQKPWTDACCTSWRYAPGILRT